MDNEEAKSNSRSRPATPPAQMNDDPDPDLAFAMFLQQEEREQEIQEERDRLAATLSTMESEMEEEEVVSDEEQEEEEQEVQEEGDRLATLSTIESETEEEEAASDEESSDGGSGEAGYDYFLGNVFESEPGFLEEGEDSSSSDTDMAEFDDIDPDELSYEELLELGEIIGEEKRGLSLEQIGRCFRPFTFQSRSLVERKNEAIDRCVICQIEYEEGEKLVVLDSCEHSYHSDCITQWLQVKKTCPICSTEVSATKKSLT